MSDEKNHCPPETTAPKMEVHDAAEGSKDIKPKVVSTAHKQLSKDEFQRKVAAVAARVSQREMPGYNLPQYTAAPRVVAHDFGVKLAWQPPMSTPQIRPTAPAPAPAQGPMTKPPIPRPIRGQPADMSAVAHQIGTGNRNLKTKDIFNAARDNQFVNLFPKNDDNSMPPTATPAFSRDPNVGKTIAGNMAAYRQSRPLR